MSGVPGRPERQDREQLAAELRDAFSRRFTPDAAALLLGSLEAGLDWEIATEAVGLGTAMRFRSSVATVRSIQVPKRADIARGLALALVVVVLVQPTLSLAREVTVAGLASALHALAASGIWKPVITVLRLDPIYAGAAFMGFGTVQAQGLSVAAPLGVLLHGLLPHFFLSTDLVRGGAAVSMVAVPGANLLARATAALGADILWLSVGLLITRRAHARAWLLVAGLFIQSEIAIGHLLSVQVGAAQLEASGVPFALMMVSPAAWGLTEQLSQLPGTWQGAVVGVCLLGMAYAAAVALLFLADSAYRIIRRKRRGPTNGRSSPRVFWAAATLAILFACSPPAGLARGGSNWQAIPESMVLDQTGGRTSVTTGAASPDTPHVVSVVEAPVGVWRYLVDGHPKVIRGVGYNPQYAALPEADRARLYDRDFADIRRMGANTIEGWFQSQFDEITLDHAAHAGLGVILPFELNQDWNYADPAVQSEILARISAWVARYRAEPALRMWAPGNENLHRVLYPNWVSQEQVPAARARAAAFAAFLPRLVDRIHELDPSHPVLYRDAEDVYLGWLKPAFEHGGKARPWFVYGANVYSETRLDEIVSRWPTQWIGGPLLISEFGPAGQGPDARALGYRKDWQRIRARPDIVLGGLAYTWAVNGPEDLDRVFGLVDDRGVPRDATLSVLSAAYLDDAAKFQLLADTVPDTAN